MKLLPWTWLRAWFDKFWNRKVEQHRPTDPESMEYYRQRVRHFNSEIQITQRGRTWRAHQ